jgi:NAD(P)-dependent dehydrogenase (short-subunit alcohol dehydrogenase family)
MTGSIASVKGFRSWSVYAASKAVLHAYARVWLSELKDRRIRVNVLTPGQVATPTGAVVRRGGEAHFEALIPRERWAALRRLRRSHCSSPQTTQAMSMVWS